MTSTMNHTTRNRPAPRQYRQLQDYMIQNWEAIEKSNQTKPQFAAAASAALGFPITENNIRSALEAIDKRWPSTRSAAHVTTSEAAKLRAEVEAFRVDLRILAIEVTRLYHGTGSVPTEQLRRLATPDLFTKP